MKKDTSKVWPHTQAEMDFIPTCDICKKSPAYVDGKTIHGPWAYMCKDDYHLYGRGLGLGRGQKLILREASNEESKSK